MEMNAILEYQLSASQAALWWLGQAGYVIRSKELTVVIDPYLSDSGGAGVAGFMRRFPPPIKPEDLSAHIIIITHNHLDHLDPETLVPYRKKVDTWFVAPALTAKELVKIGIPEERVMVLNVGESQQIDTCKITGVFALPTGTDVLDTTGYLVEFQNGRSFYHTSDTQFHPVVLAAAPKSVEVMAVPINGKWGNTGPEQAAAFAAAVQPKYVLPNHYDMMALNAENPESFKWFCENNGLVNCCVIVEHMLPFAW